MRCTPPTVWMPDIIQPAAERIAARQGLERLWSRGTAFLGCELAILGGAMLGFPALIASTVVFGLAGGILGAFF